MSFTQFDFHAGIRSAGYTTATPIQKKTIPAILEGKDVLGLAQTGTGKTAAQPKALILVPTRELAEQIYENSKILAAHTTIKSMAVYGGVKKTPQIETLNSCTASAESFSESTENGHGRISKRVF